MKYIITLSFCLLALAHEGNAQQLVYQPTNPAFGGDTFNYQWLLSSAQAQNKLEERTLSRLGANPLEDFESSLSRQILNQLSRRVLDKVFGEGGDDGLEEGSFEFGELLVEISYEAEGVSVRITNNADGTQTEIVIPYY
ncbi:MAG TPA: curli assembly protein CsgF [Chryseosolibacter sp.]